MRALYCAPLARSIVVVVSDGESSWDVEVAWDAARPRVWRVTNLGTASEWHAYLVAMTAIDWPKWLGRVRK